MQGAASSKHVKNRIPIAILLGLAVIPILFYLFFVLFSNFVGPHYLAINLDPGYAYLFNALGILNGQTPAHTDHPGTPVQFLAALIIFIKYHIDTLFRTTASLNQEVLRNPEGYIQTLVFTVTGLVTISFYWAGLKVYRVTQKFLGAIAFQLPFLCFSNFLYWMNDLSPEPFLVLMVVLISMLLLPPIFHQEDEFSWIKVVGLAGLIGCAIAAKFTAFPLLFLFILCKDPRKAWMGVVTSAVSFVFFTLPIINQYSRVWSWVGRLATHTGTYGSGQTFLPSLVTLWNNFGQLFSDERIYFILLALMGIVWMISFRKSFFTETPNSAGLRLRWILGVFLLINLIQLIMTIRAPNIRYMFPAMSLMGLEILMLIELIRSSFMKEILKAKKFRGVLVALGVLGLSLVLMQNTGFILEIQKNNANVLQIENGLQKNASCKVIYRYPASSLNYALAFGNHYARNYFGAEINKIYTDGYFIFGDKVFNYYGLRVKEDQLNAILQNGGCLLLQGRPVTDEELSKFLGVWKLEPLVVDRVESLYRVIQ